jgi:hypothetical protein
LQLHHGLASCTLHMAGKNQPNGPLPSPYQGASADPTTDEGRGRRSCRHLTGARHASPGPCGLAAGRKRSVAAGSTAERGDRPGGGLHRPGLSVFRNLARNGLDHPSPTAQTSPASRGTAQDQCRVAGASKHAAVCPVGSVPALRMCLVRGLLVFLGGRAGRRLAHARAGRLDSLRPAISSE